MVLMLLKRRSVVIGHYVDGQTMKGFLKERSSRRKTWKQERREGREDAEKPERRRGWKCQSGYVTDRSTRTHSTTLCPSPACAVALVCHQHLARNNASGWPGRGLGKPNEATWTHTYVT